MPNNPTNYRITNPIELTKQVIAQTLGTTYMQQEGKLAAINAGELIDVGKDIEDAVGVDGFTNACALIIGKQEFIAFTYESEIKSLVRESWEWGAMLERVKIPMQDIMEDDVFNLVDGKDYSAIENTFTRPTVLAKIFKEVKGIACKLSYEEERVREAMTDLTAFTRFTSVLRESIRQQIKAIIDTYCHVLVSGAIAVSNNATHTSIHLLAEGKANGLLKSSDTAESALLNEKFKAYAMQRIATVREFLKRPSTAFNNGNLAIASGDTELILLNEFEKYCRFGVLANTYNRDELSMGDYDIVSNWQGILSTDGSKKFDFATTSSVMLSADTTNKLGLGTEAVTINNVIGFAYDRRALGIYNEREKVTSNYIASADFWNNFYKVKLNMAMDSDYGMVAFILD